MKKILIIFGLVLGFATTVYADHFCCSGTKEECCAQKGKLYCENDNTCRTRCKCEPDECCGCINPECKCCDWCPTVEVCARMGKCQKIVDGCYDCVDCPEPNPCGEGQCLNENGQCCESCPRTCPEGQCLVEDKNGCYVCGECRCGRGDDDDVDDDDDDPTPPTPDDDDDVDDDEPSEPDDPDIDDDDDDDGDDDDDVDDDDDDDDDDDTETTEPDNCVGKSEIVNCMKCNKATGEYTISLLTPEKPECCNNTPYAPCPEGKVRNAETCACECSASKCQEVYGDNYECCQNECVEFCQEAEIRDMTTCECCSEVNFCKGRCYEACPEGKVRNLETCTCECETVLACSEAHLATWNPETCQCDCKDEDHIYAYCGISEEGIPEDQKKEINEVCDCVCPKDKKECGWNRCCSLTEECCGGLCYNPETQECCNDEIKENCTINGQTRNPTTCECECLDKMIVCGESCVTAPSPVIENCEKLSDDGCEIISACTEGQVCCGGVCQDKPIPDASNCEKLSDDECSVVTACTAGQSCCAGECMVQPTCDTNACQRLSEDGCTCDIICGENQTCDGAGNCVEDLCADITCNEAACETCNSKTGKCEVACGELQTCCGGTCCDYGCDSSDATKCYCAGEVCGEGCCKANEICSNSVCKCSDDREKCGENCCYEGQECKNGTICCDIIDKNKCPNGETMIASDGCEICKCESDTECPEGQVLVKNYVDNIGACGEVCCEMKEDYDRLEDYNPECDNDNCVTGTIRRAFNYQLAGAVNGVCCGLYASEIGGELMYNGDVLYCGYSEDEYASVLMNGGIPYCAERRYGGMGWIVNGQFGRDTLVNEYYPNASVFISSFSYPSSDCKCCEVYKSTSVSGDPKNGSYEYCESCQCNVGLELIPCSCE